MAKNLLKNVSKIKNKNKILKLKIYFLRTIGKIFIDATEN
jgi:hypothetical protein